MRTGGVSTASGARCGASDAWAGLEVTGDWAAASEPTSINAWSTIYRDLLGRSPRMQIRTEHSRIQRNLILAGTAVFFLAVGCAHKAVRVPAAAANAPANNSYMDLAAGGQLRIVVP